MPSITLADVRRFAATVPRLPHVAAKPGGIRPTADVAPRPKRLAMESEADFASPLEALPRPLAGFRQMAPVRSVQCFGTGQCAEMMPELSTNPLPPHKGERDRPEYWKQNTGILPKEIKAQCYQAEKDKTLLSQQEWYNKGPKSITDSELISRYNSAAKDQYHRMSQEERADWIYSKTEAEYVPPFTQPEARFYLWPSRRPVY